MRASSFSSVKGARCGGRRALSEVVGSGLSVLRPTPTTRSYAEALKEEFTRMPPILTYFLVVVEVGSRASVREGAC